MASIRREIIYPYPIDLVWEAIASKTALSSWFMETDFEPIVGRQFTFKTKPSLGFDGIVRGEVLLVEAPYRLTYSWQGGPLKNTKVSFTLREVKEGTKLSFEHSGFVGISEALPFFVLRMGWRSLLRNKVEQWLEQRVERIKVS